MVTIGMLIEDLETWMRQQMEEIYIAKTKEVVFTTRYEHTVGMMNQRMNLAHDLKKLRFG